jgi:hypothetical protein
MYCTAYNVLLMNYISNAIRMKCTLMYVNLLFCLLETTILFVHVRSFYFDQELLQQYESYSYNIWCYYFIISLNYILLFPFIHYVFYTCLLAVRRASARQAALSYLLCMQLAIFNWSTLYGLLLRFRFIAIQTKFLAYHSVTLLTIIWSTFSDLIVHM